MYTVSSTSVQTPSPTPVLPSPPVASMPGSLGNSESGTVGSGKPANPCSYQNNSKAPGYLGYTSYSTVIGETLSILSTQPNDRPRGVSMNENSPICISPKYLHMAMAVLSNVPQQQDGTILFKKRVALYDSFAHRLAFRILPSLYEEFGEYFGKSRDVSKLEELAERISINTAKPVVDTSNPDDLVAEFSGPNLRWESLGNNITPPTQSLPVDIVWLSLILFLFPFRDAFQLLVST